MHRKRLGPGFFDFLFKEAALLLINTKKHEDMIDHRSYMHNLSSDMIFQIFICIDVTNFT